MMRTGVRGMLAVLPAALLWVAASATPSAAATSCPCGTDTAAFKSCVKSHVAAALKAANKAKPKDTAAKTALIATKKAALRSSCAKPKGPKKAIACCLALQTGKDTT